MKFNYQLTEADILAHQLYILSQSASFQKRRSRGRMFLLLIYVVAGIFIWQRTGPLPAIIFYLICLPFYFIYRRLEARQYVKHISHYVHEQYKDSLQKEYTLEWNDQTLTASSGEHTHNSPWQELDSIVEIPALFILNFNNSNALIVPRRGDELQTVIKTDLEAKADTLGVPFEEKLAWKWR
jgi:hypothetical protein